MQLFHWQPTTSLYEPNLSDDDPPTVLLNRVRARFVERIYFGEVIVNLPGAQLLEGYVCADGENAFLDAR